MKVRFNNISVRSYSSVSIAATPEPQTPGVPQSQGAQAVVEFNPIVVKIVYSLRNPVDGFEFVLPNDAHPYVSSRFLTSLQLFTDLLSSVFLMPTQLLHRLIQRDAGCRV